MPDNVQLATGALVVATKGDGSNVQHQEVVGEFLSGGAVPIPVATTAPLPTESASQTELLTAILTELRVQNSMIYTYMRDAVEPLELLRQQFQTMPFTLP